MKIVIYGSKRQGDKVEMLKHLFELLEQYNIWVGMAPKFYNYLTETLGLTPRVNKVIDTEDFTADVALSIGGDGTFLRTAEWVGSKGIPILGINTGSLGFLAEVSDSEIDSLVHELVTNSFCVQPRTMLQVSIPGQQITGWPYALNEVAVLKQDTASMISVDTEINDIYLTTYKSDGLVVATPTGSTAYSMSAGGPILDPSASDWVISPVAPHSLTMRPFVVPDETVITLHTESRTHKYRLSVDGRSYTLDQGSDVILRKAPFQVKVVQRLSHSFPEVLRNKLMWGADARRNHKSKD